MKKLNFLNGLKGLLCIWVVLFHYTERYSELFGGNFLISYKNGGKVGVCIFFLISGFLTLLTVKKYYSSGALTWLKNKIIRLYPAYLIAILFIFPFLFFVGLQGRSYLTLRDLLTDMLMLPYISGKIEGAHWYVFALIKFYCCFFLIAKLKLQNTQWFYFSILMLTILQASFKRYDLFPHFNYYLNFILFNFLNIQIISGMLLFKTLENKKKYLPLLMVFIALLCLKVHLFYIPLIVLLIYFLILEESRLNSIRTWLEHPVLLDLGAVSYMWYLIHQNVGYILMNQQIRIGIFKELTPYLTLFMTFIFAKVLHFYLEAPLAKLLISKKVQHDQK